MSKIAPKARVVHITCERGSTGLLYASSPDLRGLLVAVSSVDDLREAIPAAILDLYAAMGLEVFVSPVDGHEGRTWVAFPAAIAREMLDKGPAAT